MISWKKRYLVGSKGASKEKAYIAGKMSYNSNERQSRHVVINLRTHLFENNICHRTRKIIQKHLRNFTLSKTVQVGFMTRQTHVEKC